MPDGGLSGSRVLYKLKGTVVVPVTVCPIVVYPLIEKRCGPSLVFLPMLWEYTKATTGSRLNSDNCSIVIGKPLFLRPKLSFFFRVLLSNFPMVLYIEYNLICRG